MYHVTVDVDGQESADRPGWPTLRVSFDREDEACFVVMGLGTRVDVIEPASLRDRVAAEGAAVLARLRSGGTSDIVCP
jgi:predicted butyrate kinase (DUF1464 family)